MKGLKAILKRIREKEFMSELTDEEIIYFAVNNLWLDINLAEKKRNEKHVNV